MSVLISAFTFQTPRRKTNILPLLSEKRSTLNGLLIGSSFRENRYTEGSDAASLGQQGLVEINSEKRLYG